MGLHQETIIRYATAEIPNPTHVTGARTASRSLTTSADSPGKVRGYNYTDRWTFIMYTAEEITDMDGKSNMYISQKPLSQ